MRTPPASASAVCATTSRTLSGKRIGKASTSASVTAARLCEGRGGREQGVEDQRAVALGVGVVLQPVGLAVASRDVGDGLQATDAREELDARGGGRCRRRRSCDRCPLSRAASRGAMRTVTTARPLGSTRSTVPPRCARAGRRAARRSGRPSRGRAAAGRRSPRARRCPCGAPRSRRSGPTPRASLDSAPTDGAVSPSSTCRPFCHGGAASCPGDQSPLRSKQPAPLGQQPQGVGALGAGVDAGLEVAPVVLPGDAGSAPEEAHRVGRSHEQPPSFGALATRVPQHSQEAALGAQVGQHRAEVVDLGPAQVDGLQGELAQHEPEQKQAPALEGLLEPRVDQLGLRLLGARVEQELPQQVGHHLGLREGRREALGAQVRMRRLPGALLLVEGEGVGGRGVVGAGDELDHGVSSGGRRAASARSSWRARRRGRAGARAPARPLRSTRTETRR
jgi:hypothetical protein